MILITGCKTIKQKTDAIVEKENQKLTKFIGKSSSDLQIELGKSDENNVDGEIIHKGISQRQFARSFTIADDVKVNGAELKDGLLTISCERIIPEHKKKKLIEIK